MKINHFIARLRISGNSLIVSIPHDLVKQENLIAGEDVLLIFDKIVRPSDIIRRYRCLKCQHIFDTDDINPFCTACGCKDLEEDKRNLEEDE